jgi:inositol polyphosphate 5-phosphatase INPP5B/F
VNAHLAAFDEQFEKRNSDYRDLVKRLVPVGVLGDVEGSGTPSEAGGAPGKGKTVFESDYLFWMVSTGFT